jgi:hypothetical protein
MSHTAARRPRFGFPVAVLIIGSVSLADPASAQPTSARAAGLIVRNEFVTVRDVRWLRGDPPPSSELHDVTRVYLEGRPVGQVAFQARRDRLTLEPGVSVVAGEDTRAIVIELEDGPMRRYASGAGFPPAFPRPGSKKAFENERLVVWDYTFSLDVPSPMHFHDRDVVVVFLGEGTLASTTLEGVVTTRDHTNGMTLFNPGNRLHTETLVRGACRVIVVELK